MTNKKVIIGLTGSIGSGKSTVARAVEALGYPVYYSDARAKQLYFRSDVKQELKEILGDSIFSENGQIDLKAMAALIFKDEKKLAAVNKIVHPKVEKDFDCWLKNQQADIAFHESALLFEAGFKDKFDVTIAVSAPEEVRIRRVMRRDNVAAAKVYDRMQHQLSDEEKCRRADYVILNDGKQFVLKQLQDILEKIS
jgi:dephospho-CoA kinase